MSQIAKGPPSSSADYFDPSTSSCDTERSVSDFSGSSTVGSDVLSNTSYEESYPIATEYYRRKAIRDAILFVYPPGWFSSDPNAVKEDYFLAHEAALRPAREEFDAWCEVNKEAIEEWMEAEPLLEGDDDIYEGRRSTGRRRGRIVGEGGGLVGGGEEEEQPRAST
ncbi:hypothetical protein C8R44DRAFT_882140 [Mycena epipterygia]|nr:hypothetical protein C8R44DRAFT_882140 [Mycena epipterygia]